MKTHAKCGVLYGFILFLLLSSERIIFYANPSLLVKKMIFFLYNVLLRNADERKKNLDLYLEGEIIM